MPAERVWFDGVARQKYGINWYEVGVARERSDCWAVNVRWKQPVLQWIPPSCRFHCRRHHRCRCPVHAILDQRRDRCGKANCRPRAWSDASWMEEEVVLVLTAGIFSCCRHSCSVFSVQCSVSVRFVFFSRYWHFLWGGSVCWCPRKPIHFLNLSSVILRAAVVKNGAGHAHAPTANA